MNSSTVSTDQTNGRQMTDDPDSGRDPDPAETEARNAPSDEGATTEAEEIEALTDEIESLTEELENLRKERDDLNDRLLRKAAEFENYRNRMDREKKRRYKAGMIAVLEPMLEVLDDFERSIEAARDLSRQPSGKDVESAYESLKGGVEMVFRKFRDELQSLGVEPIEAEGEPFDEQYHEAMMRQPTDEAEPGTVLQEIRKGYTMGDRVLRHSQVIVAAKPSQDADEAPADDSGS